MPNFQLLLDAAKHLDQEDSVQSGRGPTGDSGSFYESNLSFRSGSFRSSFIGERTFAEVSRSSGRSFGENSRSSRNGIFLSASTLASTESQPPNISSDLEFPLLTGVKSSNKVRPPARIRRKPLVELNGPRRHPQGNDAKHGANKAIGENLISSDRRVYAASVHPYPERAVAVTKQSKPKEDFGNSTLPDISFGDFRAPITSTPKTSITRDVRDSIESQKEDFEKSAVTAHERWSFAGWAGHAPRSDVRFQTICFMPMDGSAEAIPRAIDLSAQTRSEKKLSDQPGSPRDAVSRSDQGVPRSPPLRKTPAALRDHVIPSDHQNLATPVHTNRDSVPTGGSARDVSRSDHGVPRSPPLRETPVALRDHVMPSDRRNLATPVRTNRDSVPTGGSARDVSRSKEDVLRSLALRETPTGRRDQVMPSDRRNLATPVHTNRDSVPTGGSARDVSRSDEGVPRSPPLRKTPAARRNQGMPSDRQDLTSPALSDRPAPPLDDGRSLPDLTLPVTPDRSGCEPMELDVKAPQSDEKLQERNASSSIPNVSKPPMATHFVDVNDVTGCDQSSDESDAGSGEDYSAGSDEDWEPSSGEEDDQLHKMNDTSFLNDYTIRGYFEPFKNFIPDEQETASHKNVNGPRKYTRKLVRSARERGTGYVRQNGTVVTGRTLKAPCSCPKACGEKFSEEVRAEMLRNLLQMKSESQHQFLACHVAVVKPKRSQVLDSRRKYTRKYFLPGVNGRIEVCKIMLKATFDIGDSTIRTIARQLSKGMPTDDGRLNNRSNKTADPKHIEFIRNHILSFPANESHYNVAKSEKMYLSSDLNLSIMYRLYKIECEGKFEPVSYNTYRLIFKPMKMSFRKPRVDTCGECDKYFLQAKLSEGDQKDQVLAQHEKHRKRGDLIYAEKNADMQLARTEMDICCAAFDLQKQLPTPSLTCGKAFYARQLYTYNLTVFQTVEGSNSSDCFLWNETQAKRGSQEIGSCVLQHLESLPATIRKVIYYSDRAGGQNRNKNIVFMFMLFIERCKANNKSFEIEHKFMQTGHSHMEVDAVHERARKRNSTNIETPHDWATFISAIYRSTPIRVHELDQSEILGLKSLKQRYKIPKKNMVGAPLKFGEIMVFHYNTNCPGIVNYKYHVSDQYYRSFKLLPTEEVMRGVNHIVLNPVYFQPLPIADVKLKDLQKLMPFIKQRDFYSTFLKKLVPGKRGRRPACQIRDDFDADLSESEEEEEEEEIT